MSSWNQLAEIIYNWLLRIAWWIYFERRKISEVVSLRWAELWRNLVLAIIRCISWSGHIVQSVIIFWSCCLVMETGVYSERDLSQSRRSRWWRCSLWCLLTLGLAPPSCAGRPVAPWVPCSTWMWMVSGWSLNATLLSKAVKLCPLVDWIDRIFKKIIRFKSSIFFRSICFLSATSFLRAKFSFFSL